MRQTACLFINPIIVDGYVSLYNCMTAVRVSDSMTASSKTLTSGLGIICLWLGPPWFIYWFSFTLSHSRISHEFSSLFIIVMYHFYVFALIY